MFGRAIIESDSSQVTHTGEHVEGQIYIGFVNYLLLLLCIAVVAGFNADTIQLGNAYGTICPLLVTVLLHLPLPLLDRHRCVTYYHPHCMPFFSASHFSPFLSILLLSGIAVSTVMFITTQV